MNNRPNFDIDDNVEYDKEIPELLNSDYADAKHVFNPLFQRIIDNINAVKVKIDNFSANGEISINDIVAAIKLLQTEIQNIKSELDSLDLSSLKKTVDEHSSEIEDINQLLANMQTQIETLSDLIGSGNGGDVDLSGIIASINALEGQVADIEVALASIVSGKIIIDPNVPYATLDDIDEPQERTMYFVGEEMPYSVYMWINEQWKVIGSTSTDFDLSNYVSKDMIGAIGGVAPLDGNSRVPAEHMPDIASSNVRMSFNTPVFPGRNSLSHFFVDGYLDSRGVSNKRLRFIGGPTPEDLNDVDDVTHIVSGSYIIPWGFNIQNFTPLPLNFPPTVPDPSKTNLITVDIYHFDEGWMTNLSSGTGRFAKRQVVTILTLIENTTEVWERMRNSAGIWTEWLPMSNQVIAQGSLTGWLNIGIGDNDWKVRGNGKECTLRVSTTQFGVSLEEMHMAELCRLPIGFRPKEKSFGHMYLSLRILGIGGLSIDVGVTCVLDVDGRLLMTGWESGIVPLISGIQAGSLWVDAIQLNVTYERV